MARPDRVATDIARSARDAFHDFSVKRSTIDPHICRRLDESGGIKLKLLQMLASQPIADVFPPQGKRFLFLSTRLDQLVNSFCRDEAAIIGAPRDCISAHKHGLEFRFTGDLYAAAQLIMFGDGSDSRLAAKVIQRWRNLFARQQDPCFLVVPNDTMPIATLLVKIAAQCRNVRVACIQHGLFNSGFDLDDMEGRNSQINLVFSMPQRKEMERRLPSSIVEVMGYPSDLACYPGTGVFPPLVILVGTGTLEGDATYPVALEIFEGVSSWLQSEGFPVRYRPHPTEQLGGLGDRFPAMDQRPKPELLSKERKVFIGFCSTLLYEAHMAGHVVVLLDDLRIPGYSIEEFGVRVGADDPDSLIRVIRQEFSRAAEIRSDRQSARSRFELALAKALARSLGESLNSRSSEIS